MENINHIFSVEQLDNFLATQPIGTEAVQLISEYARRMEYRLEESRRRCNTAAKLLGNDLITECMDED